jgi:CheY-like chemotaxis protein
MLARAATRVLVVEDEPTDALMVRRSLLRSPGPAGERFEVRHATTLAEGLEHLRRDPADVLLLDLGLPDSDGLDTVRRVRVRAPDLPLVVLTGSDDPNLAARTRAAGADGHLVKGELGERLLRRVLLQAIECHGVDLSALVRSSESLLRVLVPGGIQLRFDLAAGLEPIPARLEGLLGALLELVANAVDAIGDGEGELTLRTGSCVVDTAGMPGLVAREGFEGGRFVWLEVRDTGRGFDAASLFQEEQEPASRDAGLGYGSSHLEQLLAEDEAALFVDSRPGAGATFRILLRSRQS